MTVYRVLKGKGYEVSSKGDKRFSALFAVMPDGRTLESHYQCDCKLFNPGGDNWKDYKGKPPLDTSVDLWKEYLNLWRVWSKRNPYLIRELRKTIQLYDNTLSDVFAKTDVNQARALAVILQETENDLKFYTGVGSRQTPIAAINLIKSVSCVLANNGYTLRSGAADGADAAFEFGCDSVQGLKEIWLPWKNFNKHSGIDATMAITEQHEDIASQLHPAWGKLSQGAQKLHTRNVGQVLGKDCETPSLFCLCYTDDGVEHHSKVTYKTGGTGTAIRLASLRRIPVYNLRNADAVTRLKQQLISMI